MNDLERLIRKNIVCAWAIAALAAAALIYWLLRGHAGSVRVGEKLGEIRTTTAQNERRVEVIFDAAKQREETARNETNQKMAAVSDDDLPDLLAGLLSEYRKQSGR